MAAKAPKRGKSAGSNLGVGLTAGNIVGVIGAIVTNPTWKTVLLILAPNLAVVLTLFMNAILDSIKGAFGRVIRQLSHWNHLRISKKVLNDPHASEDTKALAMSNVNNTLRAMMERDDLLHSPKLPSGNQTKRPTPYMQTGATPPLEAATSAIPSVNQESGNGPTIT